MAITVSQGGDVADTFLLDSYSTFKYDRECCDGERLSDSVKAELEISVEKDLDELIDNTRSIKWLTKTLIHRIKDKLLGDKIGKNY